MTWHAKEYNKGAPLRFTTSVDRKATGRRRRTQVKIHDGDSYWGGEQMERKAIRQYRGIAATATIHLRDMCQDQTGDPLNLALGKAISRSAFHRNREQRIWQRV